jgi:hypothetical protein
MKLLNSKKLLTILVTTTLAVFCSIAIADSSQSLPLDQQDVTKTRLKEDIAKNNFGHGQANYNMTWKQYVEFDPNIEYSYGKADNSNNCHTVWQMFTVCSSTSNHAPTISRTVLNDKVDLKVKEQELKNIVDNAVTIKQQSSSIFYIMGKNKKIAVIDTNLPMQANPVAVNKADDSMESLVSVSVNDSSRSPKEKEATQSAKNSSVSAGLIQ